MSESWVANSTAATHLTLAGSPVTMPGSDELTFPPEFTYAIFGESETLYGYRDLNISLRFPSHLLSPILLDIKWREKNEATTAKLDDVEGTIRPFLPNDTLAASESDTFESKRKEAAGKAPLGEKVCTYTRRKPGKDKGKGKRKAGPVGTQAQNGELAEDDPDARVFEIYRANWKTEGFRDLHRRIQVFALLYIEGASYIQEEEENWEFFCTYERLTAQDGSRTWHFVGYTSLYRFWVYPASSRIRLSQFLILPPYQHSGHGSALYSHVLRTIQSREDVAELTVEDPSEAFDALRDAADLKWLLSPGGLVSQWATEQKLRPPLNEAWSQEQRKMHKIAPRQWSRLMELVQLLTLDELDPVVTRSYRLQVKARLYRFNRDVLSQLSRSERVTKLQETFEGLLSAEYGPLVGVDVEPMLAEAGGSLRRLREEEEDDEEEYEEVRGAPGGKRARFS